MIGAARRALAGSSRAAALGLALLAGGQAEARCEGHVPQAKPQNVGRDVVGASLDEIVERGFLDVVLYEDHRPWSFEEGGEVRGVDAEIARLIADELAVEARLRLVAADETLDADLRNWVWRGPIVGGRVANLMLHVPYDSELTCRIEQVVFTGLYHTERMGLAYAEDAFEEAPLPGSFRTREVGVENHAMADFYLSSLMGGQMRENVVRYPSTDAAMDALASGEVPAVMGPLSQLEGALSDGLAVHAPPLPAFGRGEWIVGGAVHQAYRPLGYAVEDAIAAGLADGRIAAIFEAWGLSHAAPEW